MGITDYNNLVSPFICLSYWSLSRSDRLTFFVLFPQNTEELNLFTKPVKGLYILV
ncbi:hypothetical protein HP548_15025 [Paenibacillus taichungensis]|uniref:Uncharacterized protein n=1 Tax=Paenibacillus taichungensis TaxID=484184 RepID=A0ABX2MMV2_9BACL|nr:hypothetical protein [Paenibacillus taichungensis]